MNQPPTAEALCRSAPAVCIFARPVFCLRIRDVFDSGVSNCWHEPHGAFPKSERDALTEPARGPADRQPRSSWWPVGQRRAAPLRPSPHRPPMSWSRSRDKTQLDGARITDARNGAFDCSIWNTDGRSVFARKQMMPSDAPTPIRHLLGCNYITVACHLETRQGEPFELQSDDL